VLDVVHLGLGADGHTASLVPDDAVLSIDDRDVALTGLYEGRRRMTLTYPALARARRIVWEVAGPDRAAAVRALRDGGDIPGAHVARNRAVVVVTADAVA
ncbi:MAG: 6-phosphogluconolactonase, partial [Egibacteraceae bacterium]